MSTGRREPIQPGDVAPPDVVAIGFVGFVVASFHKEQILRNPSNRGNFRPHYKGVGKYLWDMLIKSDL